MKKYRLTAFGEALIDFTPTAGGAYVPNPGGAPFNLAVCAAKYGCKTAFIGKVGKDAFGKLLAETAAKYGVDVSGMVFDPSRVTTHTFLTLFEDGERSFSFCRDGCADVALAECDVREELVTDTELFHFGGLSLTEPSLSRVCKATVLCAKRHGALISFDPNYRPGLWASEGAFAQSVVEVLGDVDILKLSEEEAYILSGGKSPQEAAEALSHIPLVLITLGAKGALCSYGGRCIGVDGYRANAVDTTGAGDIFLGVFLSQLLLFGGLDGLTAEIAAKLCDRACFYAAKSTESYGAIPSIPNFSL